MRRGGTGCIRYSGWLPRRPSPPPLRPRRRGRGRRPRLPQLLLAAPRRAVRSRARAFGPPPPRGVRAGGDRVRRRLRVADQRPAGQGGAGRRAGVVLLPERDSGGAGAASCIPEPGDMLQWDLHLWDGVRQVRAIIGGYPHPFVQAARDGSLPPRVLFSPGAEAAARGLVSALARRGAAGVRVAPLAESEPPSDAPSLVIGPWDGIARVPLVKRSISDGARTGLFCGWRRRRDAPPDLAGTPRSSHPGAGALVAVVGGATRPAPLWPRHRHGHGARLRRRRRADLTPGKDPGDGLRGGRGGRRPPCAGDRMTAVGAPPAACSRTAAGFHPLAALLAAAAVFLPAAAWGNPPLARGPPRRRPRRPRRGRRSAGVREDALNRRPLRRPLRPRQRPP